MQTVIYRSLGMSPTVYIMLRYYNWYYAKSKVWSVSITLTVYIIFRYYSWDDADRECQSVGMYLPSIKILPDVEFIRDSHLLADKHCGLMTFLGMKRNEMVNI